MPKSEPLFKRQLTYDHTKYPGEVFTLPSLTVPDQALSLKEIIRRFAMGIPMDGGRLPVFDEENDLPDFTKMDLADREEAVERYQEELREIKERLNLAKSAVAAKAPIIPQGTAQGGASSPGE